MKTKLIPDFEKFINENRLREHHGDDWSPQFLNQSLDKFLTKLKEIDESKYNEVEKILASVVTKF